MVDILTTRTAFMAFMLLMNSVANAADESNLQIASFSKSNISEWKEKSFKNNTSYQLIKLDNENVLRAVSADSASGLVKEVRVNLKKYPYLNWKWRIENRINTANEKVKSGDDYAARIYVVVNGGLQFWKTKALSYVWAKNASQGEVWENAFAGDSAMMMALKSGKNSTSTWHTEKRNVYEDLKKLFGAEFDHIDAIALMTDTDNSKGQAKSYYGDIYFSSE